MSQRPKGTAGAEKAAASRHVRDTWPPGNRDWLFGLVLVLAVIVVYLPVRHAGFIWDDDGHLTNNPCIIGPLGLKAIWTTSAARICPLVLTTFWIEHAFWGLNPLPYHVVNVLIHAASSVLLWRVLRCLKVPGAWLGAALWALHPVQVESVAWITELKNTQSCLFYLLTVLFFVKWLAGNAAEARNPDRWNYALALSCGLLAMASKSSTVILPVVLGLCAWWVDREWKWRNVVSLAPFFLMSAVTSGLSVWTQHLEGANDPEWSRSLAERLVVAGRVVWFYLGKLLWPHPLMFVYPRWKVDAGQIVSWLPTLAVLMVLFVSWWNRRGRLRSVFFSLAYFLAALFPVLGLVDHYFLRYSFVGDHFQYLASIGPLVLAAAGIVWMFGRLKAGVPWLKPAFGAGLLLALGTLTWQQAWVYRSLETLWSDALLKNPDCAMARINLGSTLLGLGRPDEAIVQFQKALTITPNDAEAHNDLGNALVQKGQVDEAIPLYQKALQIKPRYAEAHNNLGIVLARKGNTDEAVLHYRKALEINRNFAEAYNNLGIALAKAGRVDEAIVCYRNARLIKPAYAEAHNNLGNALIKKGRVDDAIAVYETALQLKPDYAEAQNNLGIALAKKGNVDEAIAHFQKAVQINPDYAKAHNNLGVVLLGKGNVGEAIAHFQEALRINPDYLEVQNDLAWLWATSSQPSLRNGNKAVELAEKANQAAGGENPIILRTLAAAYAEVGRFGDAERTVQQAIARAQAAGQSALVEQFNAQLKLYAAGLPFHEESR